MPAHTKVSQIGIIRLLNGELLTALDRAANALVDLHAKQAVEEHRVPIEVIQRIQRHDQLVLDTVAWIGIVTHAANNHDGLIPRDAHATRKARFVDRRPRADKGVRPTDQLQQPRPVMLGGHALKPHTRGGVWCSVCRRRANIAGTPRFVTQR